MTVATGRVARWRAMTTDTTGTAARDGDSRRRRTGRLALRPGLPAASRCPHTPVWFMRQAGRSLPEYREIRAERADAGVLPAARSWSPRSPCSRYAGTAWTRRSCSATSWCRWPRPGSTWTSCPAPARWSPSRSAPRPTSSGSAGSTRDDVSYVDEAVRLLVAELGDTPLIGFAGAPFTLASYLVEGGPSRTHAKTKALMYGDPELWHALCARLAEITADVPAGAGRRPACPRCSCSTRGPARCPRPTTAASCCRTRPAVLAGLADAGRARGSTSGSAPPSCSARWARPAPTWSGVDWRTPLDVATGRIGPDKAVQGNLDPCVLFAPWPVVEAEVRRVLARGPGRPRARVQPRPRRAAGDRPRRADPGGRAGARAVRRRADQG